MPTFDDSLDQFSNKAKTHEVQKVNKEEDLFRLPRHKGQSEIDWKQYHEFIAGPQKPHVSASVRK